MLSTLSRSVWVRAPLVVFATLAIQTSLMPELRILGTTGDLMLLMAVSAGVVAPPERAVVVAFATGFVYDLVLQTPFGLTALVYAVVAFVLAVFQHHYLSARWWMPVLAVAGGSAVATLAYALLGALFGMDRVMDGHLVTIVVVVTFVNALLAPASVRIQRWALLADEG